MNLIRFNNEKKFIKASVDYIKKIIDGCGAVCRIALSGGSTPRPLYEALSKSDIDFSKVEFYQVDERYVSKTDNNSNYKLISQTLIKPLGQRLKAFYYFDTSLSIEDCVNTYAQQIKDINFDLVILGIGKDGHTASLFPNNKAALDSVKSAIHTTTKTFAVKDRLTISMKKIKESKNALLLIKGKEKQKVLNELLNSTKDIYKIPAKGILENQNLLIHSFTL